MTLIVLESSFLVSAILFRGQFLEKECAHRPLSYTRTIRLSQYLYCVIVH